MKYFNPVPTVTDFSPTSGYEGVEVTITGKYFTDATTVKFNDVEAEFTVLDDNAISAIVPETTDGTITVVTSQGTAVSQDSFTIEIATALEDDLSDRLINIYPNPSNGTFRIRMSGLNHRLTQARITLYNSLGRVVSEKISLVRHGKMEADYNASTLPTGSYILSINTGNELVKRQLLVE